MLMRLLTTFSAAMQLIQLLGPGQQQGTTADAAAQGGPDSSYFPDWGTVIGGRASEPTCVDIPEDMPLCSNIDYSKMRLPNLLDHETLTEAQKQANYWVPLLNLRCHPDTQLFLCSLFTPVCLETPIYPCRSLCDTVRLGCEARMRQYSFPWPDMLRCDKFPEDNDMCIAPQSGGGGSMVAPAGSHDAAFCSALCDPVDTLENILDHYCRADVVVKTRIKRQRKGALLGRKAKVYKAVGAGEQGRKSLRRSPRFSLASSCCSVAAGSSSKFLIMGSTQGQNVQTTFVMPFGKSRSMKKALRMFKSLNCSDPTQFTGKGDAMSKEPGGGLVITDPTKGGKKRRKNKERKRPREKKKDQGVVDGNQNTEINPESKRRGRKKSKINNDKQSLDDKEIEIDNIPTERNFEVGNSGIDMKIVEKMVEMGGVKLNKKGEKRKNKENKREKGPKKERKGRKRKAERNRRRKEKEASMQIDLSEPDDHGVNNFDTAIEPNSH